VDRLGLGSQADSFPKLSFKRQPKTEGLVPHLMCWRKCPSWFWCPYKTADLLTYLLIILLASAYYLNTGSHLAWPFSQV